MKTLVLASASPRRRELLRLLGVPFVSGTTDADETRQPEESAPAMVERLSRLKARTAQADSHHSGALVIAADTDVELDGAILGKPRDEADARAMLHALRGRAHNVFTGVTLADGAELETELTHSRVWMREYSDAETDAYIASGDPFDKAAGYAVQHPAFKPVARVEGCYANVMGLPLCRLYHALARRIPMPPPTLECLLHPEVACSVEKRLAETQ
jgi:MAF protein